MDKRLQTQVLALAMQIIGIKDPSQFKQAMTMMSEQGRTKFLNKCAEIIQSGDTSEENIAQAQQEAQQAIQEGQQGQQAILAKNGSRVTYLNRFYSGGAVKTFDGGYMKLKKPLNKNQVEGRESIGLYKGQWMYLNGDKIAVPNQHGKQKGDDGSAHINRAYNGMLIPKPNNYIQQYSIGGLFKSATQFLGKNANYIDMGIDFFNGMKKTIDGMNMSNKKHPLEAAAKIQEGSYETNEALNQAIQAIMDYNKNKSEQASRNGSPNSKNEDLYNKQLTAKLSSQLQVKKPDLSLGVPNPNQFELPSTLNLDTSLQYPTPGTT